MPYYRRPGHIYNLFVIMHVFSSIISDGSLSLSQFLKSHISGTLEAISLKFGMWSAAVGGHVHSKNRLVSSRKHRATEVRKLRFLFSCQYTHGCYAPASWAARHTTVYLDILLFSAKVGIVLLSYAAIPSSISCFTTFYHLDTYFIFK